MKKFCLFEVHEYMDMYPHSEIRIFEGLNEDDIKANAIEFAKKMTLAYSGGPTRFVKIMTKREAADYLTKEFEESLMCEQFPDDINIEGAMKVTSEKNIKLFFECYGRNK